MDEILTAAQVADLLQLNRRTVYKLARQGSIPGMKLGSGWRFKRSEILRLASVHDKPTQTSPTAVTPIKELSQIIAMRSYMGVKPAKLPTGKIYQDEKLLEALFSLPNPVSIASLCIAAGMEPLTISAGIAVPTISPQFALLPLSA